MRSSKTHAEPGQARAFTLVELMVVIVIIALLVAIVLPSVSAARTSAKVAATKSLIYTLETGLQMFRSDDSLGRDYPPSIAHIKSAPLYGAQTMMLALAGHDLQGTPGFGPGSPPTYSFSPDANGRKGPFVDVSKLQIIPSNQFGAGVVFEGAANSPLVLDSFKMPVLYFKADMGKWGLQRYDRTDNKPMGNNSDYAIQTTFWDHFNDGVNSYISDPRINTLSTTPGPYNPDSFLLISAGPDQKFGTGDDVANFTVKPQ